MMDRLMRTIKKWLVVLFAAVLAFSLLRQRALGQDQSFESWFGFLLLCFVLYHLLRPIWKAWRWWRRRRPTGALRPELPTPPQWVTPREQRRRTHDLR